MPKNNTTILYIIIAILALIILGMLVNSWYTKQIAIAQQQGYTIGVTQSIATIVQQSRNCQIVPLFIGNQTFQFIDISCLQLNQTG